MVPSTWGSDNTWRASSGGEGEQWTQSQHSPINHGDEGPHFHFPTKLLWCPACHHRHSSFTPPVVAASFTLHKCDQYKGQDFQVMSERDQVVFCFQGSQNIIILRLLNTKKYCLSKSKPLVTPSRSAQITTWCILEILRYCHLQCHDSHWRPFAGLGLK